MPFAESMISTLKSNKSVMLDKSKRFRNNLGGYNGGRVASYNLSEANCQNLKAIKAKLLKDRRRKLIVKSFLFLYH